MISRDICPPHRQSFAEQKATRSDWNHVIFWPLIIGLILTFLSSM